MFDLISVLLVVVASGIQVFGYWTYIQDPTKSNTGSWLIWTVGSIADVTSYAHATLDIVKDIFPITCALACLVAFPYMLWKKRFGCPELLDFAFLGIDGLITLFWLVSTDATATVANLLFQGSTVASFVPMIYGLVTDEEHEHTKPWLIWSSAYALFSVLVAMRLEHWTDLVLPVANLGAHLTVGLIALWKQPLRRLAH